MTDEQLEELTQELTEGTEGGSELSYNAELVNKIFLRILDMTPE